MKRALCEGMHDKGVDAVLIGKVERTVSVFQSKFERAGNKDEFRIFFYDDILAIMADKSRDFLPANKPLTMANCIGDPLEVDTDREIKM